MAVMEVPHEQTCRYGVIDGSAVDPSDPRLFKVSRLVEKPEPADAPSDLAIIGRYVLTPDIFPILEKQKPGAGGEIQLTDALRTLVKKRPIYGYAINGRRYDAGDKLGYLKATVDFALKNKELAAGFKKFLIEKIKTLK